MNKAYRFWRGLVRPFIKFFFRPKVYGLENIPSEGPLVLCANHISNIDPPMIACVLPIEICYMAKAELFEIPVLKNILSSVGTFPVKRGEGDVGAMKQALRILKDKKVLGIFPEGTRNKDNEDMRAKSGAAVLAIKTNSPIRPVAVRGKMTLFSRNEVIVGKPFCLEPNEPRPSKEEFQNQATILMNVIRELAKKEF